MYSFIRTLCRIVTKVFFRVKFVGKENIPQKSGFILASNHTHIYDVVYLIGALPYPIHFMAKKELFAKKTADRFLRSMKAFPVDRDNKIGAMHAIKEAKSIIKSEEVLGIFPEGTRSRTGVPGSAKGGVGVVMLSTKCAILPVSIYYEGRMKLFRKLTVRFGTPIESDDVQLSGSKKEDAVLLADYTMDKIKELWECKY